MRFSEYVKILRPIGTGEVIRRITCKAVALVAKSDVLEAVGVPQLCVGHESGCEAAVHSTTHVVNHPSNDAIILVDATNAFNSLNRQVALRNVMTLCPTHATILINTYRVNIDLFIDRESILYQEDVMQGDPLSMPACMQSVPYAMQRWIQGRGGGGVWGL